MRITNTAFLDTEIEEVADLSARYGLPDADMVLDIYSAFIEEGLSALVSKSEVRKRVSSASEYRSAFKWKKVLERLVLSKYFQYLIKQAFPAREKLERLLSYFRILYPKAREMFDKQQAALENSAAQEIKSLLQAGMDVTEAQQRAASKSGQQMDQEVICFVASVIAAAQDEFRICMLLDGRGSEGKGASLIALVGVGKGGEFDATFTGGDKGRLKMFEDFLVSLSERNLQLFHLAENLEDVSEDLGQEEKIKSFAPEEDKDISTIVGIEESRHALPYQHAIHTDETFAIAAQNGSLIRHEELRKVAKKQILYMLIDVSGSMSGGNLDINRFSMLCPADLASVVSLVCLDRTRREGSTFLVSFFCGTPTKVRVAKDLDSYSVAARLISLCEYNGGSTEILGAIRNAVNDIKKQELQDITTDCEICLITDARDNFSQKDLTNALNGVTLHTLFVGKSGDAKEELSENTALVKDTDSVSAVVALNKASKKFLIVDPNAADSIERDVMETMIG